MTSSKRVNLGLFLVNLFTAYFDDYLPMLPRPGPVGGGEEGLPSPVYCRGCSIIIIIFC